ncbi:sugar-phosphatase [Nicoliella spurrieriana]|uniref:Sugar-phosphatase n=1 Tax=Nicoliella spurrieriana TaxID=2925830 RepID=A0A976X5H8_9LACO|nr:sugar-phosphatase [Nicoliella spurrieriana]UQS86925.1 sugar-phosphatase [Nicoliella spurrieriana]
MDIKLIAIDIDGTLVDDNKVLREPTKQAIAAARAKGVKVVLCTGRPISGAEKYIDELSITGADEYVITFNGASVQDANGKVIANHTLTYDDFVDTEALSRKFGVNYQFENTEAIVALNRDLSRHSVYESTIVRLPIQFRTPEEIKPDVSITKGMLIGTPEQITNAKEQMPKAISDRLYVVQTEPFFLEFLHKDISKGNALKELSAKLDLKPENIMAIGDQGNDLSMIKFAGLGVAMGNAIEDNKAAAQFVTKRNVDDGVAYAINKFVNNPDAD